MVFLVMFLILILFSLTSVAFFTLMERRFLGNFHIRIGPMMVGPWGLFQPFSDAIKLFSKSDSSLRYLDYFSWGLAPVISLGIYILSLIGFPCGAGELFMNNLYLLFICFLSLSVYFFMYGGFHSGSKYSLLGSYRSVTQMISYEVILIFLFVGIFFLMNSWNLTIKNFEYSGFNLFFCMPFFLCWILVMMVESNRLPYDFLEGESELVSGFNTEYWGGYFSFFFIYEYGSMLLFSLITGFFLFSSFFSVFVFFFIMIFYLWLRSSVPRYRYDFLMDLAWKKILFLVISILEFFVFL